MDQPHRHTEKPATRELNAWTNVEKKKGKKRANILNAISAAGERRWAKRNRL